MKNLIKSPLTLFIVTITISSLIYLLFDWGIYVIIILSVFLFIYASMIIHELGHFMMGKINKFTFLHFVVGPVIFLKKNSHIRIRLNKSLYNLGQVAMIPQNKTYGRLRKQYMAFLFGGCLANFIVAIGTVFHYLFFDGSLLLLMFGYFNLLIGTLNIIPSKSSGVYSDGLGIKMLFDNNFTSHLYFYLLQLGHHLMFVGEFKDLDQDLFKRISDLVPGWVRRLDQNDSIQMDLITVICMYLSYWYIIQGLYKHGVKTIEPLITDIISRNSIYYNELLANYLFMQNVLQSREELNINGLLFSNDYDRVPELKITAISNWYQGENTEGLKNIDDALTHIGNNKHNYHNEIIETETLNIMRNFMMTN